MLGSFCCYNKIHLVVSVMFDVLPPIGGQRLYLILYRKKNSLFNVNNEKLFHDLNTIDERRRRCGQFDMYKNSFSIFLNASRPL